MRRTPSTAAPPNWSPPNWPPPPKPPSKPPPYCTQRNCKGDERGAVSRCRTPAPRQSCWNTINTRVSPLRSSSRARWEAHAARDRIQGRADGALNSRAPCRSKMGCRWRRARREFARRGAKCECGVVHWKSFQSVSQSVVSRSRPTLTPKFSFRHRGHRTGVHTDANFTTPLEGPCPLDPLGPPYNSRTRSAAGPGLRFSAGSPDHSCQDYVPQVLRNYTTQAVTKQPDRTCYC